MSDKKKLSNLRAFITKAIFSCVPDELREELIGDLQEIYEDRLSYQRKSFALLMYFIDAIHMAIGFNSLKKVTTHNNNISMILYLFKTAWRSALKQKQSSLLNLLGLVIGITTFLSIATYVHHETTFDTFHHHFENVYRINQPNILGDWQRIASVTGPNVATALREDIPEFEEVTRLMDIGSQVVKLNEGSKLRSFEEDKAIAVEGNFFDLFTFESYAGDPENAIKEPNTVLLTKSAVEKYFGYNQSLGSVIGKTFHLKQWDGSWKVVTVKGVLADIPSKSHLQFDMLVSMTTYQDQMDRDGWKWIWTAFSTYVKVQENVDLVALSDKMQAVPPKWAPQTTERIFNQTFDQYTKGKQWTLYLQPMKDIYLSDGSPAHQFGPVGNPLYVRIFGMIGILVLVLCAINFMNLSTARSFNKSKEVGVRKVLGAMRQGIAYQFVFESILFVSVATAIAICLAQFLTGLFNREFDMNLSLSPYFEEPLFYIAVLLFILVLGLLAGLYPAVYLSSFKPLDAFRLKVKLGSEGKLIRNGLVILQFSISTALIIFSIFIQKQLRYTSSIDLGFSSENILQIHNIEQFGFETELIKQKISSNPAFVKVGKSFGVPPYVRTGDRYKSNDPESEVVALSNLRLEADYVDLLDLEFLSGRNFDESREGDKHKVILNEEAVKRLGWSGKEKVIGSSDFSRYVKLASGNEEEFEVIGVVKNFNFHNLKRNILPLVIINHRNDKVWDQKAGLSYYSIKFNPTLIKNPDDMAQAIEKLEQDLAEIDPTVPFEYSFMDKDFEDAFRDERKMGYLLNIFTVLAVIIACLGLFGLAAYTAERRVVEMGIRKVLGANVANLILLFTQEFIRLLAFSVLIGMPVAYFSVESWLESFAYRTTMDMGPFLAATIGTTGIALLTITYQSLKVALQNPVESLKDE